MVKAPPPSPPLVARTMRPAASIHALARPSVRRCSIPNARTVSKWIGTQAIAVESKSALSATTSVDSGAMVTATSRSERRRGSNIRIEYVLPGLSSPPNARRRGSSVGSTMGRCRGTRVNSESGPATSHSARAVSPDTVACEENRPRSPSNLVARSCSRSARDSVARLWAVVRCSTPSAGTSSTRTSSTRMVLPAVSIVEDAKPTCCPATARR